MWSPKGTIEPDQRVCLDPASGEALHRAAPTPGTADGSACTASSREPGHVLAAVGTLTHGNVRLSVWRQTRADDVERLPATLPAVLGDLRSGL